jgi:hypothetical protein
LGVARAWPWKPTGNDVRRVKVFVIWRQARSKTSMIVEGLARRARLIRFPCHP